MTREALLVAGGVFAAGFAIFHLLFWKLFRWGTELAALTSLNRAVVQVLNLCLTFVFVIFAYVSIAHPAELLTTGLGRALVVLMAVFWYLRALEQVVFFGWRKPSSVAFLGIFLVGGSLYAAALL